ncbi:hypothetical protein GCM10011351_31510 [Paraliobacillus quinghaiensis]|uniref:Thioredoxin domain-containing protein n=1 Tax=Paraliobacillus quinghaiensis TaxID=470815 RepID=A0A917TXH5_9BACI|nr:hypothetical protein [Paraliobacillus quinghaiensis]GGM43252.1 hypothetical protein GCM10011351_31510 [Paraliobacillus quinghaiensis]
MYEDGKKLPTEMQESVYENVMNILEGTEQRAVASWVPYDDNYVVDYKEELDIEQFPAILVFNKEELLYELAENTRDFSHEMNRLRTRDGHLPSQLSNCLRATCK